MSIQDSGTAADSATKADWLIWLTPATFSVVLAPFACDGSVRLANMLLARSYFVTFEAKVFAVDLIRATTGGVCLALAAFVSLFAAVRLKNAILGLVVTFLATWLSTAVFVGVELYMNRGRSIESTLRLSSSHLVVAASFFAGGGLLVRPFIEKSIRGTITVRKTLAAAAAIAAALAALRNSPFLISVGTASETAMLFLGDTALFAASRTSRSIEWFLVGIAVAAGSTLWALNFLTDWATEILSGSQEFVLKTSMEVVVFFGACVWWNHWEQGRGKRDSLWPF